MKQERLVPKRRFEGFNEKWTLNELNNIVDFFNNMRIPIDTQRRVKGIYPYYGATGVIDYVDDYILEGQYVLLAEDGENILSRNSPIAYLTRGKFWVNNHAHVMKMKSGSNLFLIQLLEKQEYNKHNSGTAQPKLNGEVVRNMTFNFPSVKEQQKIGRFFKHLDEMISLERRKIEKTKALKSAYLAEMFPAEGERVPKRRFAGFTDDWKKYKLDDIATYRRGSFPQPYGNKSWYDEDDGMPFVQVVDVGKNLKLVNSTKQKISKLAQPRSVFVEKGKVLVTLQGSIGRVAITQYPSFVDRTLLIFESYKLPINKDYFAYTIQQLFQVEKLKAPGGTIKTITIEALSNFLVYLPNIKEQNKIGSFFKKLDDTITNHEHKLAKLKSIKQAYLHEMFV